METDKKKSNRGFAAMAPEKRREIARAGGIAVHKTGRAHEYNSDTGSTAGRKGGQKTSENRAHTSEIGRLGARRRGERLRECKDKLKAQNPDGSGKTAATTARRFSSKLPKGRCALTWGD